MDSSKLDNFPQLTGVYLMKGRGGTVLYVGKAKNLRQRVKQYFAAGGDGREMVPYLIAHVVDIETIVVHSEKEALLLENVLIKQHRPKYNALFKDDKNYIAIKINNKHKWPMMQLVRYHGKQKPDGLYFGPYTSGYAAHQTLDLLQRLFPLRQCSDQVLANRSRPCILYDMKRCIAPCVAKCTKEEYDGYVQKTINFLSGQDKEVLKELQKEMATASEALEFEKAAALLRKVQQIETTVEAQHVQKPFGADFDALGIYREGNEVVLSQLMFRGGTLIGSRHYNFTEIAEDDTELLEAFLLQHAAELPREILLPVEVNAALSEILPVELLVPQRGEKREFIALARTNAEATFKKEKDEETIRERTLAEMQERLHLKNYPARIDCFDNSHLGGSEPVSALVTFLDGKPDRKGYRKYKIKGVQGNDDYAALDEVLMRRYRRAQEESNLPDLLIIDGGKGHLQVALKAFSELNIITVDIIAVAKEEGRHDRGMTLEQIFLPDEKEPLFLSRTSPILFLLQKIRDETHRVAITFQRKRRSKAVLKSVLDDIPGMGPVRKKLLLRHFGSLKGILAASEEELRAIPGLPASLILKIRSR